MTTRSSPGRCGPNQRCDRAGRSSMPGRAFRRADRLSDTLFKTGLLILAVVAGLYLTTREPTRLVKIRWSPSVSFEARAEVQKRLGLRGCRPESDSTPTELCDLIDWTPDNMRALVSSPAVEDTSGFDRGGALAFPSNPQPGIGHRWIADRDPRLRNSRAVPLVLLVALVLVAVGVAPRVVRVWSRVGDLARDRAHAEIAWTPHPALFPTILVVSACLRVVLVARGGQFYWPDEQYNSRVIVAAIAAHDVSGATAWLAASHHDQLFKLIGVVPATVERLVGEDARILAMFFALVSVLNLWLLAKIAGRLGAGPLESTLAALLLAASASFSYYSRHVLAYDTATALALGALFVGLRPGMQWRSSAACGALAGCAFLTYQGYWTLGGAACVIHVLEERRWRGAVRRALVAGAALAGVLAAMSVASLAAGGAPVEGALRFARTVTQGDFAEGWRLPVEYLWHAEHGLLVVWLSALAWSVVSWRPRTASRRIRVAWIGVTMIYGCLAFGSTVLQVFVVYGRLARQLVPFLCLLSAAIVVRWLGTAAVPATVRGRHSSYASVVLGAALLVQTAVNMAPPLVQEFPREFRARAKERASRAGASTWVTQYAEHLYPPPLPMPIPHGYRVAYAARHPLQFLPYQYEGYTPAERRQLRATDIRMRLIVPEVERAADQRSGAR